MPMEGWARMWVDRALGRRAGHWEVGGIGPILNMSSAAEISIG